MSREYVAAVRMLVRIALGISLASVSVRAEDLPLAADPPTGDAEAAPVPVAAPDEPAIDMLDPADGLLESDGTTPALRRPRVDPELRQFYLRGSRLGSPSGPRALKKPAPKKRESFWKHQLELGATGYRGNTDSELLLFRAKSERTEKPNQFRFGARATVGNKDGKRDRENGEVEVAWRRTFSDRWYATAESRYFTDKMADVDYQVVTVLSPGYDVLRHERAHIALEIGPAYIVEKKGDEEKDFVAARLALMMDTLIDERVLLWERIEYLPALEDSRAYLILVELGVESIINDWFRIRTVLQQRYDNDPADDKDKRDLFVAVSLVAVF